MTQWWRAEPGRQFIFDPREVAALLKYASEKGLDTDDGLLRRLYRALNEYEHDPDSFTRVTSHGIEIPVTNAELILTDYAKLTKLTDGVNGRCLLDGRNITKRTLPFMVTSSVMFALSVAALAYGAWVADETPADDPLLDPVVAHVIQYFAPFLWGALGSCVYILKRVSDEAAENHFNTDRFQGWLTRALLGAILGGTITYVVDEEAFGTVSVSMTALAFLTGVGTKVVYGGLERMISLIAEKFNLDAVGKARPKGDPVSQFLAKEIANTDRESESERYQVLVALLESRSQKGAAT